MYYELLLIIIVFVSFISYLISYFKFDISGYKYFYLCVNFFKDLFFLLLIIFLFRSFVLEPFRIPSGSMMPTLLAGDFIFVNKFIYGLKVPFLNYEFISFKSPKNGDIIVFNYNNVKYIKRVVGLPGDKIFYKNDILYVNNRICFQEYLYDSNNLIGYGLNFVYLNKLIFNEFIIRGSVYKVFYDNNIFDNYYEFFDINIPMYNYFVLGDNRNDSYDSRFWGLVSENDICGKPFLIWFSYDKSNVNLRLDRFLKQIF